MDAVQKGLLDRIEAAFGTAKHPGWEAAYEGHPRWVNAVWFDPEDPEYLPEGMKVGDRWQDTRVRDLQEGTFLLDTTPQAFPYFLAAHMWHGILDPEGARSALYSFFSRLADPQLDSLTSLQLQALTVEQTEALRHFIAYAITRRLADTRESMRLREVWDVKELIPQYIAPKSAERALQTEAPGEDAARKESPHTKAIFAVRQAPEHKVDESQRRLLDQIEAAFGAAKHPGWEAAYRSIPDADAYIDDGDEDFCPSWMRVRDPWQKTLAREVRNGEFLLETTPQAFPYFLAAHMWHSICDPGELNGGVRRLIEKLARLPDDSLAQSQFAALTAEQTAAVRSFVLYAIERRLADAEQAKRLRETWDLGGDAGGDASPPAG